MEYLLGGMGLLMAGFVLASRGKEESSSCERMSLPLPFFALVAQDLKPGESTTLRSSEGIDYTVGIRKDGTHYVKGNNKKSRDSLTEDS